MPPKLLSLVPLLSSTGLGLWHVWVYLDLLFPMRTCKRQINSKPRLPRDTQEIPELSAWHTAPFVGFFFLCNNAISAGQRISDADSHHKTHCEEKSPWHSSFAHSDQPHYHGLYSSTSSYTVCLWPTCYKFQNHRCFTWCCTYLPLPPPQKKGRLQGDRHTHQCHCASFHTCHGPFLPQSCSGLWQ